jgi:hypothetical protein
MAHTVNCIAVLAITPTGEQLYFEIRGTGNKRVKVQVKPGRGRKKIPKDDEPCYWYTEDGGILTLEPSFYDKEIDRGFKTADPWTTEYERITLFGSVKEVDNQLEAFFNSLN